MVSYLFVLLFSFCILAAFAILMAVLVMPSSDINNEKNIPYERETKELKYLVPSTKILQLSKCQYDDSFFELFDEKKLSDHCYLILIHLGEELPLHIFDCIDQLCIMGVTQIHFIVDSTSAYQRLTFCNHVIPYLYPSNNNIRLKMNSIHGDENVFHLSLERFFALRWFMTKYNVDKCIHIEHDNLIYIPLGLVEQQLTQAIGAKIACPRDRENRCIASVLYVGSRLALEKYCDFVECEEKFQFIDMESLSNFENKYADYGSHLPVIPVEYKTEKKHIFNNSLIPFIFDAAALGQWVGGVDIIHTTFGVDSRGFLNPDAQEYYNANDMPVVWILTKSGKKVPLVYCQGVYTRLCNLHIHAKRLHLYLSTNYMDPEDIIQGNKFKEFSDIKFHTLQDIMDFSQTQHSFIKKPEIIYVKTDFLVPFFEYAVPNIVIGKFILITHNSDYCITQDHTQYLNNSKLIKWFAQNCQIEHPKLVPIPIGIANSEFEHGNTSALLEAMKTKEIQQNVLYVNLSDTHPVRKQLIDYYASHENVEIDIEKNRLIYKDFLSKLKSFQFISAPRGNGPDTHRLWEIYYLNGIPITYDKLFQTIPCIPDYYAPFIDVGTFEWKSYSDELIYLTQIRGLGRIYSRMSYWKYMMRKFQKQKHAIDAVLITDDSIQNLQVCINSIIRYVTDLNRIYLVRLQNKFSESTNENIVELNIDDFIVNHCNDVEYIKLHLHQIPNIKQKILWVDSKLCFTGDINFQTYQNKDLFTSSKGNDQKYKDSILSICSEITVSPKLNVDESYHAIFDKDILKELQSKIQTTRTDMVPSHVLYFHYLKTFYNDKLKIRNLFYLIAKDTAEYESALKSHYYRFVINLL